MKPVTMVKYTDEVIMKGLREGDERSTEYFRKECYSRVRSIVQRNSGSAADVEDILHDGLIVLFDQLNNGPLHLSCTLKTYFYSICQFIWLKRLERNRKLLYRSESVAEESTGSYFSENNPIAEEELAMTRLMFKHLETLPEDCRQLISLYLERVSFARIAQIMNLKDAGYVKTRKYMCKNMLRKRIMKDPDYKQFIDYD